MILSVTFLSTPFTAVSKVLIEVLLKTEVFWIVKDTDLAIY
jgi:hypothetical protein